MIRTDQPIIGICAYSGTGKTTLMTRLIPLLKAEGLRLTVIKHGHHALELDQPGKDSYKFRAAGADQVVLASSKRLAIMQECNHQTEPSLQDALKVVHPDCADLILVEGFKHEAYPKIELHRPALHKPLLYPADPHIVAIACDGEPDAPLGSRTLLRLDLNQPEAIVRFIMDTVVNPLRRARPTEIRSQISCADAREPGSLSLEEARARILNTLGPVHTVVKRTLRETLGQILAVDVISPLNVPAHTNSAMDGYALAGDDLPTDSIRTYRVIGTLFAGQTSEQTCLPGECVRIMTGAPMPAGTDTVIMQEHTEVVIGEDAVVRIGTGARKGINVRQAGEDIAIHQTVLQAGRRITPADLGLLASLGVAEVKVYRAPRVAFFSTGDELRSIGEPLDKGCVYDSNRYTLYGMLKVLGMEILDLGVVPDDPVQLEAAFKTAAASADVVITSGGVSVGEADYTKRILDQMGQIDFWKIAIKPGRPLAFGTLGDTVFFGLPGNPVAVMVTFELFVRPALLKLAGERDYTPLVVQATCTDTLRKRPGRTELLRAVFTPQPDGSLHVGKAGVQGSGVLTSMSKANCYIVLDEENAGVEPGDRVLIQVF